MQSLRYQTTKNLSHILPALLVAVLNDLKL